MATNGEVIQRVQSQYSKGVQSDDSRLMSRHIYSKLKSVRSLLVAQKLRKNQKLSEASYQSLNCLKLVETTKHNCPCVPPIGCMIYKVDCIFPQPTMGIRNYMISSVSDVEGDILFNPTTWKEVKYNSGNKYTSKNSLWFIKDNILYVVNNKRIRYITIRGVFDDPVAVDKLNAECTADQPCCDDNSSEENACISNLDLNFVIDGDLLEPTIRISVEQLIGVFAKMREDVTNNSADSAIQETK